MHYRTYILYFFLIVAPILGVINTASTNASDWKLVNDPEQLKKIFSNTVHQGTAKMHYENLIWRAEYCEDGKGVLYLYDLPHPRSWRVTQDGKVCSSTQLGEKCYYYEASTQYSNHYRIRLVKGQAAWIVTVYNEKTSYCSKK